MAKPFLIVRASIEKEQLGDFLRWYVSEHLPHVMAIPGVVKAYRSTCHRKGINWTTLYMLADDAAVQKALSSSEAEAARRDWERWLPHVSELSVEVYSPLGALPAFHHWN